jgi:hydrogenase maturation protease
VSAARTLLVGLGNPILGDDGIGPRLARDLAAGHQGRDGLEVLSDGPAAGLDLVERLAGYARVILVDAFAAPDLPPGTLLRTDASALSPAATTSHVHAMELAAALEVGRRVGLSLPPASEIHVLGVVARATDSFSETLSPELERAYPGLCAAVSREVDAICRSRPLGSGPA